MALCLPVEALRVDTPAAHCTYNAATPVSGTASRRRLATVTPTMIYRLNKAAKDDPKTAKFLRTGSGELLCESTVAKPLMNIDGPYYDGISDHNNFIFEDYLKEPSVQNGNNKSEFGVVEEEEAVKYYGDLVHPFKCKPCAFYHKKGCRNENHCNHCHSCVPQKKRNRPQQAKAGKQRVTC
eukprot:GHVP01035485.1.p1 GENE.GHVP01035485.1~~GHVP01035485.1.p1  ORF type:complete len:181 (-),score=19.74 GHVP01035485.1:1902-2444(-)